MAIGGVVINFVAKTTEAIRDVTRLEGAIKDVGDESTKADRQTGRLGRTMKVGLAAGAALAGGAILGLANFLIDAGKAAYEDQKSAERLAHTLKSIPGVTDAAIAANEDWITSMQLATHVADTDIRNAIGKLTLATGDLEEAQRLAAASADLATLSGKDYSTVADAMAKAAAGNTTALKRLAPWLDVNKDSTVSLSEALGELEGKHKDAAEAAANTDPWETIKIIWDELKESLGQWLLPLLERFGKWFKDPANQKKIQQFIDRMGDLAYEVGKRLVPALEDFLDWLKDPATAEKMREIGGYIETMASAMEHFATYVKIGYGYLKLMFHLAAPGWLNTLLGLKGILPGGSRSSGGGTFAATSAATTATPAGPVQPPTVIVTEEQVYRAITGLIMRGDVRNGRRVRIA